MGVRVFSHVFLFQQLLSLPYFQMEVYGITRDLEMVVFHFVGLPFSKIIWFSGREEKSAQNRLIVSANICG